MIALLALASALSMSPFEKNDPLIDDGMKAFDAKNYEEALSHFEAAAKERPNDARVQFNLGATLHKLGRDPEAKQALTRAESLDSKHEFTNKIQYNRGTIAAAQNEYPEAVKAFRAALKADPSDELSRHNLEVTLRQLPPKNNTGADGGTDGGSADSGTTDAGQAPDAGTQDGGSDGGRPDGGKPDGGGSGDSGTPDSGNPDAGPSDGGSSGDGGPGDGGRGDGGQGEQDKPGDGGQPQAPQRSDGGADGGASNDGGLDDQPEQGSLLPDGGFSLSKKEAEKALDAMKNGEKNLQLWRFRQKTQKNDNHGKDW